MGLMRYCVLAAALGLAATSCALTLDFDTNRGKGAGTGTGAGGGTAGGAGGAGGEAPAAEGWVASLVADTPGSSVRMQSVAVIGDRTLVGGYYIGESLSVRDAAGTDSPLHTGEFSLTTFVLALDASGNFAGFTPIARSNVDEIDVDSWGATRIFDRGDGRVLVASAVRAGETLVDGSPVPSASWNLVLGELDAAGAFSWASRCAVAPFFEESPAHMGARFSGFTRNADGTVLFGTTVDATAGVACETLIGDAGAGDCDVVLSRSTQSAQIWSIADGGACASVAGIFTENSNNETAPVWLDGLAGTAGPDVMVGGRLNFGGVTVQPWGASIGDAQSYGLAGTLQPNGSATSANLQALPDAASTVLVGPEERFAGSVINEEGALDLLIGKRGETPLLLGSSHPLKSEAALALSVDGGAMLIGGWMTDGSSMAEDVCGPGCVGDLPPTGPTDCEVDVLKHDGFWLLVQAGTTPGLAAVGRPIGGCLEQRVVAGHLGTDTMHLVLEIDGSATIDLLDGDTVAVDIPPQRTGAAVVMLPRPALGN